MTRRHELRRLRQIGETDLRPSTPFHFDGTFWKPQHFPTSHQAWVPGVFWQSMRLGAFVYGVKVQKEGTAIKPTLRVTVYGDDRGAASAVEQIAAELHWRYDLDSPRIAEFVRQWRSDRVLGKATRTWKGMRPKNSYSLYEYLVITAVLQNTTVRRSVAMLQALFDRYGQRVGFDGKVLSAFWEPSAIAQTTEEELRN